MNPTPFKKSPPRRQGFALIVTLSLMILLTVVAVGLLSLSSISLRSASQDDAMQMARANRQWSGAYKSWPAALPNAQGKTTFRAVDEYLDADKL